MSDSAILIDKLFFSYNGLNAKRICFQSLEVKKGECIFLFGPSGSGKSTLLSLLGGVLKAQSGILKVLGTDYAKLGAREMDQFRGSHIGYVFQGLNLIPYLSVRENILLGLRFSPRKMTSKEDAERQTLELCQKLGLSGLEHKKAAELSVGQQQRVAVARAILGAPELILADEPTSALDADHRDDFLDLLFEQVRRIGSTLIFVSHDLQLATKFDRSIDLRTIIEV